MTLVLAAANCNTVPAWWHWDCQCDTRHAWLPIGCFTGYGLSCPFHRNFHRFLDATDSALAQPQLTLASEWYAGGGGCERVYGRRMQAAKFPGVGGQLRWPSGRVVRGAWNSKAPQQAGHADDPGLDPSAMLSQGARTQRPRSPRRA